MKVCKFPKSFWRGSKRKLCSSYHDYWYEIKSRHIDTINHHAFDGDTKVIWMSWKLGLSRDEWLARHLISKCSDARRSTSAVIRISSRWSVAIRICRLGMFFCARYKDQLQTAGLLGLSESRALAEKQLRKRETRQNAVTDIEEGGTDIRGDKDRGSCWREFFLLRILARLELLCLASTSVRYHTYESASLSEFCNDTAP